MERIDKIENIKDYLTDMEWNNNKATKIMELFHDNPFDAIEELINTTSDEKLNEVYNRLGLIEEYDANYL